MYTFDVDVRMRSVGNRSQAKLKTDGKDGWNNGWEITRGNVGNKLTDVEIGESLLQRVFAAGCKVSQQCSSVKSRDDRFQWNETYFYTKLVRRTVRIY